MARDDFSKPVIDRLQRRVAGRCSNPACRRQTLGPGTNVLAVVNVGVAAHIHAASPGGPRFKAAMTRDERRGFHNALWLCATCANLIDRDIQRYPAELLSQWKMLAENQAMHELGQQLPSASDAVDQLATAFTGQAAKFIPHAIGNVHSATSTYLATLDPRFRVETEFRAGTTRVQILAREPVDFSIEVDEQSAAAWEHGMSQLMDRGRAAVLPMKGVSFIGSRLLEVMHGMAPNGSLKITPKGKNCVLKFVVPQENGSPSTEELLGTFSAGRNAMHFKGAGFGGIVNAEMDLERTKEGRVSGGLRVTFGLSRWEGIDVRQTPYLDKVYSLLRCLVSEPSELVTHLEIEGEQVLTGQSVEMGASGQFDDLLTFVAYVRRARSVARGAERLVPISLDTSFSVAENSALSDAADTFDGKRRYDQSCFTESPSFTLVTTDGGEEIRTLTERNEFQLLQIRSPAQEIMVFGHAVTLPSMELNLHCVRLHVNKSRVVDAGMEFDIRTELGPDFLCEYRFVKVADNLSHVASSN